MKKKNRKQKSKQGFTLVEALVGIFILAILSLGIYGTYAFGIKVSVNNRLMTEGAALAEKQIEAIHAMTYEDIGISGGIPSGTLPATSQETVDKGVYTIKRSVRCIDDPYNGLSPTDKSPCNYKQIEIKVSWPTSFTSDKVVLDTIVAPPSLETELNMGVLMVNISNGQGVPVSEASIQIKNSTLSPAVDFTTETAEDGSLTLPGAKPATTSYDITATKSGYETVKTYPPYPTSAFNPLDSYLSVAKGAITSKSFVIDMISALTINLRDTLGGTVPNATFGLKGGRTIGTTVEPSPKAVYYFTEPALVSNASGNWSKTDLGKGPYYFTITNANYELITTSPVLPWTLAPNGTQTVTVTMGNKSNTILVLTVKEFGTETVVSGATVRLLDSLGALVQTATTDDNGVIYFPQITSPAVTLTPGATYTFEVSKTGYITNTSSSLVNGITRINVSLSK